MRIMLAAGLALAWVAPHPDDRVMTTVRALLAHDPTLPPPPNIIGREAAFRARFNGCREVLKLIEK